MKQNRIRVGSDDIRVPDCDAEVKYWVGKPVERDHWVWEWLGIVAHVR